MSAGQGSRLLVLALALGAACAGGRELWLEALRADAASAGALAPDAALVLVWAETPEAAWARIVRARTEAALEESELLALSFERASVLPVQVVAGGPHPVLNDQVLIDAFLLTLRDRLPRLHLVYVSPEPPGEKLVEVLGVRGASWQHVPWSGVAPPR